MKTAEIYTIDDAYMIEFGHGSDGFHVKDLSGYTALHTYTPPYKLYLYYYTNYGVWRRTNRNGKWEFDNDKQGKHNFRPVIIRECGIPDTHSEQLEIFNECKKGGNKMKSLFHVILFNKKTEEIEFDKIMPASNKQDVTMQAAQLFGKYNSKGHVTIVWELSGSAYEAIK